MRETGNESNGIMFVFVYDVFLFNRPNFRDVHLLLMYRKRISTKNTCCIYVVRKYYRRANKLLSLAVPGEKLITQTSFYYLTKKTLLPKKP